MNPEKYSSRYDPPKTPGIENGTGTSGPTGSRTSAPFAPLQTEPISPLVVSHDFSSPAIPSPPEQRFELVDQNFSRPARRSKTGLELFPPGTFGSPTPYDNDVEHIEARTGAEDDVEEGAEVDNQSPHYLKRQGGMFTKSQQTNQQHSYYVSTHF
ncbi:hypothetical protein VTK73DRAFT_7260 [Phialemonium thermophilum]|uniref:Uncharacterized protein n=1 Tax=Phialemonium thermophilum TaxID=223376 RepID=A0ABR3XT36_9PEZI